MTEEATTIEEAFAPFATAAAASAGIELDIPLPNGEPSGQHMTILGEDSDAVRVAELKTQRALLTVFQMQDGPEKDRARLDHLRRAAAAHVGGWTLGVPCTPANVIALFRSSPYLQDWVTRTAGQRARFLGSAPKSLSTTPEGSSPSMSPQEDQESHSEST